MDCAGQIRLSCNMFSILIALTCSIILILAILSLIILIPVDRRP